MRRNSLILTATVLACYLLLFPPVSGTNDGPVSILYVGCILRSTPYWLMRRDPLFAFNWVQATLRSDFTARAMIQAETEAGALARLVRLHMPRSYAQLSSQFDVIILANANVIAVGPTYIEMLARGVKEGGLGLLMSGGWESFGGTSIGLPWGNTAVGELLPTEDAGTWIESGYLVIDEENNEFISSIDWPNRRAVMYHNAVTARQGADMLAHVEGSNYENHPAMVTWRLVNGARTFSFTGEPNTHALGDAWAGIGWEYQNMIDMGSNLMLYVDGRPVPQDIALVHRVRSMIQDVATRKTLLLSLVDFVESFGANTRVITDEIDRFDLAVSRAEPVYLELRFHDSLKMYEEAGQILERAEEKAMAAKDRALLWIYAIEWLTVAGTTLITGAAVWNLMIRRKMYKEARVTRLTAL